MAKDPPHAPDNPFPAVSWVLTGDETFGVRRAVLNLMLPLREQGCTVGAVCITQGSFAQELTSLGVPTRTLNIPLPPPLIGRGPFGKLNSIVRLIRYGRRHRERLAEALRSQGAGVAHFLWPHHVPIVGGAARSAKIMPLWEMPNVISPMPLRLNARLYQHWCRQYGVTVLANSAFTASTLGDRPVRPIVFHLASDEAVFRPDRADTVGRAQLGIDEGDVVFVIAARLDPTKGQAEFFDALADVSRECGERLHLVCIGGPTDGPTADALRERARASGIADRLHFAGNVADPWRYFGLADVGVSATRVPEGFGLSVVELMLSGRPVLVHALGGPAETVLDGVTGWHVHAATPESFRAGIARAIGDRARWPEMGIAARRHAVAEFGMGPVVARYRRIVGEARARMCS